MHHCIMSTWVGQPAQDKQTEMEETAIASRYNRFYGFPPWVIPLLQRATYMLVHVSVRVSAQRTICSDFSALSLMSLILPKSC